MEKFVLWLYGMACYLSGVGICTLVNRPDRKRKEKAEGKPIIRHCRNCEYSNPRLCVCGVYCNVKYKGIDDFDGRLAAVFCRYYKQAGGSSPEVD